MKVNQLKARWEKQIQDSSLAAKNQPKIQLKGQFPSSKQHREIPLERPEKVLWRLKQQEKLAKNETQEIQKPVTIKPKLETVLPAKKEQKAQIIVQKHKDVKRENENKQQKPLNDQPKPKKQEIWIKPQECVPKKQSGKSNQLVVEKDQRLQNKKSFKDFKMMWQKAAQKTEIQNKGPYRQKLLQDLYKSKQQENAKTPAQLILEKNNKQQELKEKVNKVEQETISKQTHIQNKKIAQQKSDQKEIQERLHEHNKVQEKPNKVIQQTKQSLSQNYQCKKHEEKQNTKVQQKSELLACKVVEKDNEDAPVKQQEQSFFTVQGNPNQQNIQFEDIQKGEKQSNFILELDKKPQSGLVQQFDDKFPKKQGSAMLREPQLAAKVYYESPQIPQNAPQKLKQQLVPESLIQQQLRKDIHIENQGQIKRPNLPEVQIMPAVSQVIIKIQTLNSNQIEIQQKASKKLIQKSEEIPLLIQENKSKQVINQTSKETQASLQNKERQAQVQQQKKKNKNKKKKKNNLLFDDL